jgi:hypothetical protein
LKFTFATWLLAEYQGRVLTWAGVENRLVSYAEVEDVRSDYFERYVRDGYVNEDEWCAEQLAKMSGEEFVKLFEEKNRKRSATSN